MTILYKDSFCNSMDSNLEEKVNNTIPDVEIIVQEDENIKDDKNDDTDEEDSKPKKNAAKTYNYGPICIMNLKTVLSNYEGDPDKFIKKFQLAKFYDSANLTREKFRHVFELINKLSTNEPYKKKLKEFIDHLPMELNTHMKEYKDAFAEEMNKDEDQIDYDKIRQLREKHMSTTKLENIKKNCKARVNDSSDDYEADIKIEFPEETLTLKMILDGLEKINVDKNLYLIVEQLSQSLGIDSKKMNAFYASREKKKEKKELPPKITDLNEIIKQLPPRKATPPSDGTPLSQLLLEIVLGMDEDDKKSPEATRKEITELEENFKMIKVIYEIMDSMDLRQIKKWAKSKKGHLKHGPYDVCKAIATMDRVFNMQTNFRYRDPQILAVLTFLLKPQNEGKLCQIKTGEGKTYIVSLVAVCRVLQGHKVDVITSSPILAQEGVDETKVFYSIFNIRVGCNNPGKSKICYEADIVYGTISSFQFDYLRDSFTGEGVRMKRQFEDVILDEVDSMLVDNGGHIAKLASPYPGMEYLRYIYVKIWQELHKAEVSYGQEAQNKIEEIRATATDQLDLYSSYEKYMKELSLNERKIIKEKILKTKPADMPLLPKHLEEFVQCKIDTWLKNAIFAKYECKENEQYRIVTNKDGEKIVAPIDYLNTGVTLKTTIWSNGLHQFIQLKHNLHLTFESLTSCYISNLGYIKKYQESCIFGMTGTLGSTAEQKLLKSVYNVNYAKLPTFKEKKFREIPGLVCINNDWSKTVTREVLNTAVDDQRAVLLICETVKDALKIEYNLRQLKEEKIRIRMYASEEDTERKDTEGRAKIGDIIVATNIAGRGTNFKTEKNLEANGGLHVCVGFLPCNQRVEDQAFGRTSRQGNKGTAQLIIRRDEVLELGIVEFNPDFAKIKKQRDLEESKRLDKVKNVQVKELDFKDGIFGLFSELFSHLNEAASPVQKIVYKDLKEFWAFWLEKKNYNADNIKNKSFKKEYEEFKVAAANIIQGQITHNPFYCLGLADIYLKFENYEEATAVLERAKFLSSKSSHLLTGVHMREFAATIYGAKFVKSKIITLIAEIISFGAIKVNDFKEQEAVGHLDRAMECIDKEIKYLKDNFDVEEKDSPLKDILLPATDNPFIRHTHSRLYCLEVYRETMQEMKKVTNSSHGAGVEFKFAVKYDMNFLNQREEAKGNIFPPEVEELNTIGMNVLYGIKKLDNVPEFVRNAALAQIAAGVAVLAVGLIFAPTAAVLGSIASTLISEGIIDLITSLLQSNEEFKEADFLKGKAVSYATALVTLGISAVKQSITIMETAAKFCRRVSGLLRKCPFFKGLCNVAAEAVENLAKVFDKFACIAKFGKMSQAQQLTYLSNLDKADDMFKVLDGAEKLQKLNQLASVGKLDGGVRKQFFKTVMKDSVKKTANKFGKKNASGLAYKIVIKPMCMSALKAIADQIANLFKTPMVDQMRNRQTLMEKLRSNSNSKIDDALDIVLLGEDNLMKKIYDSFGGSSLVAMADNILLDIAVIVGKFTSRTTDIVKFAVEFSAKLDERLTNSNEKNSDVDTIVNEVAKEATLKIMSLIMDLINGTIKNYNEYVEKYGRKFPMSEADMVECERRKMKKLKKDLEKKIPTIEDTVKYVVDKV